MAGAEQPEPMAIRGYTLDKKGQREITFDKAGAYVVDDGK